MIRGRAALIAAAITVAALALVAAPMSAQGPSPGWLDGSLSFSKRAEDLVAHMTLEEKVSQTDRRGSAIDRLGIPGCNQNGWALHGVARSGLATSFPQAIGLAATWHDSLLFRVATVISDEARAKNNEYLRNNVHERYQGLTFWSPNINLFRDPRWVPRPGDPTARIRITGRLLIQFHSAACRATIRKYLKTIATSKHFAVHSGPEPDRHTFDAVVSERDLHESYLPHFEAGIREGGAWSLMCAYNRVDGKPACASTRCRQYAPVENGLPAKSASTAAPSTTSSSGIVW